MSQSVVPLEFPALYQSVPAASGWRVLRGALSVVLVTGVAAGIAVGARALVAPESGWAWFAGAGLVAATAVSLVAWLWGGLGGRWLPDLLLGLRTVRVADAGRPGGAGLARAALLVLGGLPSAGIVPLVLSLAGRDAHGRCWQDRLTGLATIDVRRGRDVHARPVNASELDALVHRPVVRPAIIEVSPGRPPVPGLVAQAPGPLPQPAVAVPRVSGFLPPAPAGTPVRGVDGPTRVTSVVAPVPSRGTPATWRLSFDTGQTHLLRESAILGRAPAAQPSYRGADLVRLEDPSQTVSATHLAVRGNEVGVWVEDLGSTNGSEVVTPSGRAKALAPRSAVAVPSGGRVRLGDRWFTIEAGPR